MVLSQLPPDDPKALQRQREANPSLFQALVNSNFNISTFLPHITANTFNQLKQIMNDTVEEASNFMPPSQACSGASPVLDDAKVSRLSNLFFFLTTVVRTCYEATP